jgi:hypothetical protein
MILRILVDTKTYLTILNKIYYRDNDNVQNWFQYFSSVCCEV